MMPVIEHEPIQHSTGSRPSNPPVVVDPTRHNGWDGLVARHAQATIFHTAAWARVLQETYGHNPFYLCLFDQKRLTGVLPLMELKRPFFGTRGISLPFTDFCPALADSAAEEKSLRDAAMIFGRQRHWKYLECRGSIPQWSGAMPSLSFYGHTVDLTGGEGDLENRLSPSIQRGLRKAEKAGLAIEFSTEVAAVKTYYQLHCRTRQRHGLPPQPYRFFANIHRHVLAAGHGFAALVRRGAEPLAGGIFFGFGAQALYKFGASDYVHQEWRPNNLLMWGAMRHCARQGYASLHLGRTSLFNTGLRRFKLALGAKEDLVRYSKYDFAQDRFTVDADRAHGWFNAIFARMPLPLLRGAGEILYPHLS